MQINQRLGCNPPRSSRWSGQAVTVGMQRMVCRMKPGTCMCELMSKNTPLFQVGRMVATRLSQIHRREGVDTVPHRMCMSPDRCTPRLPVIRFKRSESDFSRRCLSFTARKKRLRVIRGVGPPIDTVGVWDSNPHAPTNILNKFDYLPPTSLPRFHHFGRLLADFKRFLLGLEC